MVLRNGPMKRVCREWDVGDGRERDAFLHEFADFNDT
jgi:hypothetical protein